MPETLGTQQDDWSHMGTLLGARPKWNRAERPSGVMGEPRGLEAEASGRKADPDVEVRGAPAPPLPLFRRNMQEAEGGTPPRRIMGDFGFRTRVAPQILRNLGVRIVVRTVGMYHGLQRTFW